MENKVLPRLTVHSTHDLVKAIEVENMFKLSKLMLKASLVREESRGFHFRKDFPYTDNGRWLKRILLRQGLDDSLSVAMEEVETPFVRPKESRSLPPGVKRTEGVPK